MFDAVAVLAAAGYWLISIVRFNTFQSGMDLTIFGQAGRQYATCSEPLIRWKAQLPFNILGDHFSPILAAPGPVYAAWPDVRVLLAVQAVLLGVGVAILGRCAARRVTRTTALLRR